MPDTFLIVNADDFGASAGVNRAIADCHTRGVLTSTSLMVTGAATDEAVRMSRDLPAMSIGLHWDVWGEDEREFDLADHAVVKEEFERQLGRFHALMGRPPTHVDSHRHAHREDVVLDYFRDLVAPLGIPLRRSSPVRFLGAFYGQWEWQVTDLYHVSVEFLQKLITEEVEPGWTELSCHPGYVTPDYQAVYMAEREVEVQTLTDPRVRETIDRLGIRLASYADFAALARSAPA